MEAHFTILDLNVYPFAEKSVDGKCQGNRMALENTRNRLAALYGERAQLTGYVEGNRYITRLSYPYPPAL